MRNAFQLLKAFVKPNTGKENNMPKTINADVIVKGDATVLFLNVKVRVKNNDFPEDFPLPVVAGWNQTKAAVYERLVDRDVDIRAEVNLLCAAIIDVFNSTYKPLQKTKEEFSVSVSG